MARKPLVLMRQEGSGCIIPASHKLNQDGYFRKCIDGKRIMYHVHIYSQSKGQVPQGYEVHHTCGNRACCNPDHLALIEGHEHAILTNHERYEERMESAKEYWRKTHCTGTRLAEIFNVTFSTGCRWIREWKV